MAAERQHGSCTIAIALRTVLECLLMAHCCTVRSKSRKKGGDRVLLPPLQLGESGPGQSDYLKRMSRKRQHKRRIVSMNIKLCRCQAGMTHQSCSDTDRIGAVHSHPPRYDLMNGSSKIQQMSAAFQHCFDKPRPSKVASYGRILVDEPPAPDALSPDARVRRHRQCILLQL